MGFIKKIWKNRISEFPRQYQMTQTANGRKQLVELELKDGAVTEEGDRFDADTMNDLEDRIEAALNDAGVSSFNSRSGAVTPQDGDYSSDMVTHINADESESTVQAEIEGLKTSKVSMYEQNSPYWDTTPTRNSNNPVTSDGVNRGIEAVISHLRSSGSSGTPFYFDSQNGDYGWNESSARGAQTFHPFADSTKINAQLSDYANILGVKNFIPPDLNGIVESGITYTYIRDSGAVAVTGTSGTEGSAWNFSYIELPAGTYILTTGQAPEEGTDVCIYALTENSELLGASSEDHGSGIGVFSIDTTQIVHFGVGVEPEKEVDITLFPMCRPASITDDTFVPYAATNKELTKKLLPVENVYTGLPYRRASGISGLQIDIAQWGKVVSVRVTYTPTTSGTITLAHELPTNILNDTYGTGIDYATDEISPNYIRINAYGDLKIFVMPEAIARCRFSLIYLTDFFYTPQVEETNT